MKIYYYDKETNYENLSKEYQKFYDLINNNFKENENFRLSIVNFNFISYVIVFCKKFNVNYTQTIDINLVKHLEMQSYLESKFYESVLPHLIKKDNEKRMDYC